MPPPSFTNAAAVTPKSYVRALVQRRCREQRVMDEKTRREVFSMAALQGILASQKPETYLSSDQLREVVQLARTYADVLIAELMREQVAAGQ
jgi:hypothetical protein